MSRTNKISAEFTLAQKESVLEKISETAALMPFLISLPDQERRRSFQMGPKSAAYVQQCLEGAQAFPNELKSNFDVAEFKKDVTLVKNLLGIRIAVTSL